MSYIAVVIRQIASSGGHCFVIRLAFDESRRREGIVLQCRPTPQALIIIIIHSASPNDGIVKQCPPDMRIGNHE